jgi:GNAT superfamily N-acetyltransferase
MRNAMSMTIRHGVSTDAAALAELAARTFSDTFAADNRPEDMGLHVAQAYGPLQQGRELVDPDIATLLVQAGDQLVGYAQLRRGPAPACVNGEAPIELWRFYVAQVWHGQGIAQALMRRVDAEADRSSARTLWLGVWERNERAKAFYRKCGFVDVGAHVFMVGSDAQTDRILVRPVAHLVSNNPS